MSPNPAPGLLISIDSRARETLQQQIYGGLRRAILEGVLAPGTRVQSSRALAADLGVSRTTSLLALEQLLAEGYLAARRGSGTFVARELPDDLPRKGAARLAVRPKHPPLSRRARSLAAIPPAARPAPGTVPKAFRLGSPALNLFPVRTWAQLANRRLRSVTPAQLDYGEAAGLPALRAAIAEHVGKTRGTRCSPDEVFVVAGAQRGLEVIFGLLLDPGDRAWLEEPGYPGARRALQAAGARIVPVRVSADGLDVEAGARRAGDARLAFVTPSHQFPLGVPMSLPRRLALLKWASAADAWVVEDDYDSEFRYGARPIPCLRGLDLDGRVIYVGSFSKTLFPALRLGFLVVPADLRDPLTAAYRLGLHASRTDQAVLADFMAGGHYERHLRRMRAVYRERLEALVAAAERHCGGALRLRPVRTGLHAVADLVGVDADRVAREATRQGLEVMPLSTYYAGRTRRPANGLVLGFGAVSPEVLGRGMQELASVIEKARRGRT